jgi:protease IV
MKRALLIVLASIGGIAVFGFLFLLALSWALLSSPEERIPNRFVLELDLTRGILTAPADDPFAAALERGRPDLVDVLGALHRAAEDDRVLALRVLGGTGVGGWAVTDELRDAVLAFRRSGKPAHLFAETFGELAPAQGAYHLATAFDVVALQPSGDVGLTGISLEAPFFRGLLDRYQVEPVFEARGPYKDAVEIFTGRGFSTPSREALEALLHALRDGLVAGIAEGRGLSADSALTLLARGPYSGRAALEAGLVDHLLYADEAREAFDRLVDPEGTEPLPRVRLDRYAERVGTAWDRGERIALVHGSGVVQRGTGPAFDPLGGGTGFRAGTVASHLRSAASDPRTRAIIFRVDSPGGSWVASDLVRREVARAREKGIPVVVSMGNAAASGGYLVSLDADRIVAHPSTITGSIGVAAGRFVLDDFLGSFGVTLDQVTLGDAHRFFGGGELGPEDRTWLAGEADRIYEAFVEAAARGRGMTFEEADAVAQGRVWAGRDALEVGLVDALGGIEVALDEARALAGLEPDAPVELRRFPARRSLFELFMDELRGGGRAELGAPAGPGDGSVRSLVRGAARALVLLGSQGDAAPVRVEMQPLRIPGS